MVDGLESVIRDSAIAFLRALSLFVRGKAIASVHVTFLAMNKLHVK